MMFYKINVSVPVSNCIFWTPLTMILWLSLIAYQIPILNSLLYDYDWYSWLQRFNLIINFPILGVSKNHSALSKHGKYFNLQQFDMKRFFQRFHFSPDEWNSFPEWQNFLGWLHSRLHKDIRGRVYK